MKNRHGLNRLQIIFTYLISTFFVLITSFVQAEVTYIHFDHLGSTIAESNEAGDITQRYHYTPFGKALGAIQEDDPGYTGHVYDDDLGLNYMQARYYDPNIGIFYANDPASYLEHLQRGNPLHGFNRYTYANNNPYKYVDPDGEFGILAWFGTPPGIAALEYGATALVGIITGVAISEEAIQPMMDESPEEEDSFETDNPDTSNPLTGNPGSCSECNNKHGKKKQRRFYGKDGYPDKDIDYDHSHGKGKKNSGKPHVHDWSRPEDGSPPTNENRGDARPPEPQDLEDSV